MKRRMKNLHYRKSEWIKMLEDNLFNLSIIEMKERRMTVNDKKFIVSSSWWEFINSNKKQQQSQELMKKKKKLLESELSKNTFLKNFEHAINLL